MWVSQKHRCQLEEQKAVFREQDAALTDLDAWTAQTHDLSERLTVLLPQLEAPSSRPSDAAHRILATLEKKFRKVSTCFQMANQHSFCERAFADGKAIMCLLNVWKFCVH